MHPEITELISLLEAWISQLRKYHGTDSERWVSWLEKDLKFLRNSDSHGLEDLLSAFGGMGSITDFALVAEKGNCFQRLRARYLNGRYAKLVNRIYVLATKLRREELLSVGRT